jgi:hypothetical protein
MSRGSQLIARTDPGRYRGDVRKTGETESLKAAGIQPEALLKVKGNWMRGGLLSQKSLVVVVFLTAFTMNLDWLRRQLWGRAFPRRRQSTQGLFPSAWSSSSGCVASGSRTPIHIQSPGFQCYKDTVTMCCKRWESIQSRMIWEHQVGVHPSLPKPTHQLPPIIVCPRYVLSVLQDSTAEVLGARDGPLHSNDRHQRPTSPAGTT